MVLESFSVLMKNVPRTIVSTGKEKPRINRGFLRLSAGAIKSWPYRR